MYSMIHVYVAIQVMLCLPLGDLICQSANCSLIVPLSISCSKILYMKSENIFYTVTMRHCIWNDLIIFVTNKPEKKKTFFSPLCFLLNTLYLYNLFI